jgi:hypothetical protein
MGPVIPTAAQTAIGLFEVLAPLAAQVITFIRHGNGQLTLIQILDADTAEGNQNIADLQAFIASKKTA